MGIDHRHVDRRQRLAADDARADHQHRLGPDHGQRRPAGHGIDRADLEDLAGRIGFGVELHLADDLVHPPALPPVDQLLQHDVADLPGHRHHALALHPLGDQLALAHARLGQHGHWPEALHDRVDGDPGLGRRHGQHGDAQLRVME